MRTVSAVTIALALCAPLAAGAAPTDLSQMVSAYRGIQVVRVIERFENGAVATVDVMPAGQYRIASTGGQDPSLIIKLATQPVPDVNAPGASYNVKSLGSKTLDGVKANGYTIAAGDGSYLETIWFNPQNLPLSADVQTLGHKVNLQFGDYNNSLLIGAR